MDTPKVNQIISDYVRHNLSPTKPERDTISIRYKQLQDILPGQTFQSGSYARHTSTTPVNDLDVIYILPESIRKSLLERKIDPSELGIDDILNDLAKALDNIYNGEARIVVQPHSVGIFFGEKNDFSIDVVPAQPLENGLYLVPETSLHSINHRRKMYESKPGLKWIKSDPEGYINQATEVDGRSNGNFRKATKFVKKWRQGCKYTNDDFALKSFHLEVIVTDIFKRNPFLSCHEGVQKLFLQLPTAIAKPQYPDRADPRKNIDDYVASIQQDQLNLITTEIERAAELNRNINTAKSEAQVLKNIEELLRIGNANGQRPLVTMPAVTRISPAYSKPYCY